MDITGTHTVTPDEASYEVTKALLPFLIEAGHPRKRQKNIVMKTGVLWQTQ